ncbi:MAG: ABC transporter permease [Clostridia bacterium]|nr:ABC transporter permease [Clostridia bacterium]
MINLSVRNFKLFFRNKSSVFFSLLGAIIIILLYVLFLGDMVAGDIGGVPIAREVLDNWIMAGLLAVTSITTTMGAFGRIVEEREGGRLKDFFAAPIRKSAIVGGYLSSAVFIGIIMTLFVLVLAEVYIIAYGGSIIQIIPLLKVLGIIVLSVISSGSMVFFAMTFIKNSTAFGTASTILGTLIGFLTGIYIPIGVLPTPVQWVIKLFPVSHAGALFRQIMMEDALARNFASLPIEATDAFKSSMGVVFDYGGYNAPAWLHILVLVGTAALFFSLAVLKLSMKKGKSGL